MKYNHKYASFRTYNEGTKYGLVAFRIHSGNGRKDSDIFVQVT